MNVRKGLFFCCAVSALLAVAGTSATAQVWRKLTTAVGYNVGINPHNPNSLYCEGTDGLISISRDRGKTWNPVPASVPISGIRHIFIAPRDTLTMFVVAFNGGLWRSTDEGGSWNDVLPTSFGGNLQSYGIDGESMTFDPTHPDTMFAGNFGDGAVYRSLDRGATWGFQGLSGTSRLCALTIRPDSTNILFAGTGNSTISKSYDYGVNWKMVNSGGTQEVPKIVIHPNTPLVAWATTNSNGDPAQDTLCNVWKTIDGGETWFKTSLQKIANWSMAIDVQHPETLIVGLFGGLPISSGMRRTTDGGNSFTDLSRGVPPQFASWNLRIHPLDPTLIVQAGTASGFFLGGGVYRFMDTSSTRVQGTVRDAVTNLPVKATLTIANPPDSVANSSSYEFGYYDGDPTLTPSVHVEAAGYYAKDTTLTFVMSTVQTEDIHLTPLPFNSVNGEVFNDANGNGVQDPGETGLAGWLVRLSGPVNDSMLTDANGLYAFDSLTSGTYTVSQQDQESYVHTFPVCPSSYSVDFVEGTSVKGYDFGDEPFLPGALLLSEDFTTDAFPPPCWSIDNVNGGITWHRITSINHSEPASARDGFGTIGDGKADDWLFSRPVQLFCGRVYRLSFWDRTFINNAATGIDSLDVGFGQSPSPGAMTIINSRGFNTNLLYENVVQDFTVGSAGEYYIGFHDYSAAGNTLRIDDVTLNYIQPASTGFISGMKFKDLNDNGVKDPGEPGVPNWRIRMSGSRTDSTLTDANGNYIFTCVAGGLYFISEESKAGWAQTFPISGSYTIPLAGGDSSKDNDFGNWRPNSITVRKFEDLDGNFATEGDRVLKDWHLEVRAGDENGGVVAQDDAPQLTRINLTDGNYAAVESDTADWIHLGYLIDGQATQSTDNHVTVSLTDGQNKTIDFVNAGPAYSRRYRTASYLDWATAHDAKGKPKSYKRKFDKVFFKRNIGPPANATGFTLKFNMPSDGKVYTNKAKADTLVPATPWDSVKSVTYAVPLNAGDSVQIEGRGYKGSKFEVTAVWAVSPRPVSVKYSKSGADWKRNEPGLPPPNLHNVGEELFPKGFGQGGITYFNDGAPLIIGTPKGTKGASSVKLKTYANVLKSLVDSRSGMKHTVLLKCLGRFDNHLDSIKTQVTSLSPTKQNNASFAELLTLRLNIAASATNKFPVGLGELTFDDPNDPSNPFNGQQINVIAAKAESLLSCVPVTGKPGGADLGTVTQTIHMINAAFTGSSLDTVSFGVKTVIMGALRLADVPYLHVTPGAVPVNIDSPPVTGEYTPEEFLLNQNYPNPFNPTTTISFTLGVQSVVSLKVYNTLGQEVAAVIDHQLLDEGDQEAAFDASSLASGVYFYRLTADPVTSPDDAENGSAQTYVSMKKMVLLK